MSLIKIVSPRKFLRSVHYQKFIAIKIKQSYKVFSINDFSVNVCNDSSFIRLTDIKPLIFFYAPWKPQETRGFLIFLGGISIFFFIFLKVGIHLYNSVYNSYCRKYVTNCSNVYPLVQLHKMSGQQLQKLLESKLLYKPTWTVMIVRFDSQQKYGNKY